MRLKRTSTSTHSQIQEMTRVVCKGQRRSLTDLAADAIKQRRFDVECHTGKVKDAIRRSLEKDMTIPCIHGKNGSDNFYGPT